MYVFNAIFAVICLHCMFVKMRHQTNYIYVHGDAMSVQSTEKKSQHRHDDILDSHLKDCIFVSLMQLGRI